MKCKKCGAKLNDNANFCRVCGSQISTDVEELNHSSIQENKEPTVLNESVVDNSASSTEIKKILEEMNTEEKKINEPTVTIPTNLIKKYCKSSDKKEKSNNVDTSLNELKKDFDLISKNDNIDSKDKNLVEKKDTIEDFEKNDIDEKIDASVEKEVIEEQNNTTVDEQSNISNLDNENKILIDTELVNEKNELLQEKEEMSFSKTLCNESKESIETNVENLDDEDDISFSNKKHYGRTFFVFFIIMICLFAIGYLVYVLYGSRNELEKVGKENALLQEEVNNLKNNNLDNNQMVNGVIFNGYKFTSIKDNYSISNDSLVLKINNILYTIKINNKINFDDLKDKKDAYKQQLINEGYKIISYGNKHVDNNDYYVFSVSDKDNKKYLIAYTKLSEKTVIAFIIHSGDNNISYDLLSNTNTILSSISKSSDEAQNDLNIFIEKK